MCANVSPTECRNYVHAKISMLNPGWWCDAVSTLTHLWMARAGLLSHGRRTGYHVFLMRPGWWRQWILGICEIWGKNISYSNGNTSAISNDLLCGDIFSIYNMGGKLYLVGLCVVDSHCTMLLCVDPVTLCWKRSAWFFACILIFFQGNVQMLTNETSEVGKTPWPIDGFQTVL